MHRRAAGSQRARPIELGRRVVAVECADTVDRDGRKPPGTTIFAEPTDGRLLKALVIPKLKVDVVPAPTAVGEILA